MISMNHKTFTYLYFLASLSFSTIIHPEGFNAHTLVTTKQGLAPIKQLKMHDLVVSHNTIKHDVFPITHTHNYTTDSYVKITIAELTIYAAPNQKFYSATRNKWIQAKDLKPSELLLCANTSTVVIDTIKTINTPMEMYSLTVQTSHLNGWATRSGKIIKPKK
jgi:hypothetical protein